MLRRDDAMAARELMRALWCEVRLPSCSCLVANVEEGGAHGGVEVVPVGGGPGGARRGLGKFLPTECGMDTRAVCSLCMAVRRSIICDTRL